MLLGAEVAIEEGEEGDLLTLGVELLCHLEGDDAAEGEAHEVVGPLGLQRAHLLNVVRGEVLDARWEDGDAIAGVRSEAVAEAVDGLLDAEARGEVFVMEIVDAEEGRPRAAGLDGDEGVPGGEPAFLAQDGGELLYIAGLEDGGEWEAFIENFLDAGEEADAEEGVAAEIEEIVVDADAAFSQDFLPYPDEAELELVAGGHEDAGGIGGGVIEGGEGFAVEFAVGEEWERIVENEPGGDGEIGEALAEEIA